MLGEIAAIERDARRHRAERRAENTGQTNACEIFVILMVLFLKH